MEASASPRPGARPKKLGGGPGGAADAQEASPPLALWDSLTPHSGGGTPGPEGGSEREGRSPGRAGVERGGPLLDPLANRCGAGRGGGGAA